MWGWGPRGLVITVTEHRARPCSISGAEQRWTRGAAKDRGTFQTLHAELSCQCRHPGDWGGGDTSTQAISVVLVLLSGFRGAGETPYQLAGSGPPHRPLAFRPLSCHHARPLSPSAPGWVPNHPAPSPTGSGHQVSGQTHPAGLSPPDCVVLKRRR